MCLLIGAVAFLFAFQLSWNDNTVRTIIVNSNLWPEAFSRVKERIIDTNPDTKIECYLLHGKPGKFSIDDALFRISNATPAVFDSLTEELDLVPTETDLHVDWRHRPGVVPPPAEWWASPDSMSAEFFICRHRLEGDEGDLYYVTFERDKNTAYIDYYFNF